MRWVARRSLQAVATLLAASALFFTAMFILPGDPIRAIFGVRPPPPAVLRDLRAAYGLDQGYLVQYLRYLGRLLHGDLGVSYYGREVTQLMLPAIPRSLTLLGGTLVTELGLVTAAIVVGSRGVRWQDRLVRWTTLGLAAIPVVVLGYLLQAVLAVQLGWLPRSVGFAAQGWTTWVLPVATLALWFGAVLARQVRDDLDRERHEPHVRTATAKGLSRQRVTLVHTLRPAIAPSIHLAGAQVGQLIASLIVVEGIFDVGGVGTVLWNALQRQDRAVVVGATTALVAVVVVATAVVDLVAAAVDPRQRERG